MTRDSDRSDKIIRVLIVDDHPMMRLGLTHFLGVQPDILVAGEANNASDALERVVRLKPDLVILDISLPGRSGLDLIKDLRVRFPEGKVLVHSMHDEQLFAERAMRLGAGGYVTKHASGKTLLAALRKVGHGGTFYAGGAARGDGRSAGAHRSGTGSLIAALTDREFEVFRLIGQGLVNRDVAGHLGISIKTVEAHREHLRHKLGAGSATALNLLAVRWAAAEQTN